MNSLSKIFAVIISLILILCLSGCSKNTTSKYYTVNDNGEIVDASTGAVINDKELSVDENGNIINTSTGKTLATKEKVEENKSKAIKNGAKNITVETKEDKADITSSTETETGSSGSSSNPSSITPNKVIVDNTTSTSSTTTGGSTSSKTSGGGQTSGGSGTSSGSGSTSSGGSTATGWVCPNPSAHGGGVCPSSDAHNELVAQWEADGEAAKNQKPISVPAGYTTETWCSHCQKPYGNGHNGTCYLHWEGDTIVHTNYD